MLITVDRSSVAMGDDVLPHVHQIDMPPETSLADVVVHLLRQRFLAIIAGGKATWILTAGRPLAVVAQQWTEPRFLVDPTRPIASFGPDGGGVSLMFRYRGQRDPDHVFAELTAGREPPR